MDDEIITPDAIARELRALVALAEHGPDELKRAELRYQTAESAYQDAYDSGYKDAEGTIAEREIAGRLEARVVREIRDEERAELNRVKARIRQIENSQVGLSVQLKAVMVTYQDVGRS